MSDLLVLRANEPRRSSSLRNVSHWSTYAAAAGATLAMAANADASIIYGNFAGQFGASPSGALTASIGSNGARSFVIGPAVPVGVLVGREYSSGKLVGGYARLRRRYGYSTGSGQSKGPHAYFVNGKFSAGQTIKGKLNYNRFFPLWVQTANGHSGSFGPGTVSGFLGFELFGSGVDGTHFTDDFGWLRIKVSDPDKSGYASEVQVIDYAYNTVANAPIEAGQTTDAVRNPALARLCFWRPAQRDCWLGASAGAETAASISGWMWVRKSGRTSAAT